MKIHLLTTFYLRPSITPLFIEGVKRLWGTADLEGTFVVSNEEDYHNLQDYIEKVKLPTSAFTIIQFPNNPVSNKHNAGLFEALKRKWDALLIMGSDDLLSNEGLALLAEHIEQRPYVGFNKMHVFSNLTHEWRKFEYSDCGRLIGCGRMIRREVLDRLTNISTVTFKEEQVLNGISYLPRTPYDFPYDVAIYLLSINFAKIVSSKVHKRGLWNEGLNRGLDHSTEMNLAGMGIAPYVIKTEKIHLIDVKTDQNITSFRNFKDMNVENPKWFLGEREKEMIAKL